MNTDELRQSAIRNTEAEIYNMILGSGLNKIINQARSKLKIELKFLNDKTLDEETKAYHDGIAKALTEFIMRHTTYKPTVPEK